MGRPGEHDNALHRLPLPFAPSLMGDGVSRAPPITRSSGQPVRGVAVASPPAALIRRDRSHKHAGAGGGDFVAVAQGAGPVELAWSGLVGAPGAGGFRAVDSAAEWGEVPAPGLPATAGREGLSVIQVQAVGSPLGVGEHFVIHAQQQRLLQPGRWRVVVFGGDLGQIDHRLHRDIQPGEQFDQQGGGDVPGPIDAGRAGQLAEGVGVDVDGQLQLGAELGQWGGDGATQRAEAVRIMTLPTIDRRRIRRRRRAG